ncbi:hypothetical protein OIU85_008992 [Salix viminalis]|uniref:Uncharacterized protein n=1 Tax=Salix viminalis TaxID=40686 RepID=A0A9Q0SIP0_SALVM|nr:hypothetical protein OIU85_008992 [Salix viminalis]
MTRQFLHRLLLLLGLKRFITDDGNSQSEHSIMCRAFSDYATDQSVLAIPLHQSSRISQESATLKSSIVPGNSVNSMQELSLRTSKSSEISHVFWKCQELMAICDTEFS